MKAGARLAAAAVFLLLASAARAQMDFSEGSAEAGFSGEPREVHRDSGLGYAQALEMTFSSQTLTDVQLSSAPAAQLSALLERGYYHLELVELILLAQKSGSSLDSLVKERDKGKSFSELAAARGQDAVALYDKGLDLRARADAFFAALPPEAAPAPSSAPVTEVKP